MDRNNGSNAECFNHLGGQRLRERIEQIIEGYKVIGCFDNIIHRDSLLVFKANGSCFENEPGLFLSQAAPFNTVGIVGQIHLCFVIQAPVKSAFFSSTNLFARLSFISSIVLIPKVCSIFQIRNEDNQFSVGLSNERHFELLRLSKSKKLKIVTQRHG